MITTRVAVLLLIGLSMMSLGSADKVIGFGYKGNSNAAPSCVNKGSKGSSHWAASAGIAPRVMIKCKVRHWEVVAAVEIVIKGDPSPPQCGANLQGEIGDQQVNVHVWGSPGVPLVYEVYGYAKRADDFFRNKYFYRHDI